MKRAWQTAVALLIVYTAPLVTFWQTLVKRQPGLALLAAIAWLFAVAAGWLFWRIASTSVDRHVGLLGSAFDRMVGRSLSRYGKVYGQWVLDSRRFLDAKGLATIGTFSPELDEVFVDVGLTARAPRQVPADLLGRGSGPTPGEITRRQSIWDFLDQEEPVVLAAIGAPGSGKTTLLNHVARRTARTAGERRRSFPVLLQLRDHARTIAAEPGISLPELIRKALPSLPIQEPAGWWDNRLTRGKCVVLLDGLDEVADTGHRRDVVAWANQQIAIYRRNDFVVTSRPHGYRDAYVESATTLQVLSFTPDQVRTFLHGWYLAVERKATGTSGREVEMLAREAADDLLDRLAGAPALYDLTINPLLLTMIANVHRFRRSLPNSRAELYGEVCQVMLWRRQEAKRLDLNLPGASKERLLSWLAYEMMRSGTRDIGRRQLLDGIRPRLKRVDERASPEDFVADVGSNGMLVERERDLYAFAHLTFQEYLAARYIQDHGLERTLRDAVDDPWWREVTLLYLAGADADTIVEEALRSGTTTALSLAFECAEVGAELAQELRHRLSEVLHSAFEPDATPENRRLVAGVLASRWLRRLVPTTSGARVCPDPVPADLYWLFRQDTGTPPPDTRTNRNSAPVRGVWSGDAIRFVSWINALQSTNGTATHQGTGLLYRLPAAAELNEVAKESGPAAQVLTTRARRVWTSRDGHDTPGVWASRNESANVVPARDLIMAAAADLRASTVPATFLTLTAIRSARQLAPTGDPILDASVALNQSMQAIRTGHGAGGGGLESPARLDDLQRPLREAVDAATRLNLALRHLTGIDRGIRQWIDAILARHPMARAVRNLEHAASLGRDVAIIQEWNRDLGVDIVLPAARSARNQIKRARIRLQEIGDGVPGEDPARLADRLGIDIDLPGCIRDPDVLAGTWDALGPEMTTILMTAMAGLDVWSVNITEWDFATRFTAHLLHHRITSMDEAVPVDLSRLSAFVHSLPAGELDARVAPDLYWLREAATPALLQRKPITATAAAGIRFPALLLAAFPRAGLPTSDLLALAAAPIFLQRRARDPDRQESIVLATA